MTSSLPRHCWAAATTDSPADGERPAPPAPLLDLRCHRGLRGPYAGGGALVRSIVPDLLPGHAELVTTRATEVIAIAPELASLLPTKPRTLTELASPRERSRFYAASRTLRLSHGLAELLMDWARIRHPGGVVIAFRELDDADPTDRELVCVLLRRCDPRLVTVLAETDGGADDALTQALASYACRVARLPGTHPRLSPESDLAQLFIDSDGTSQDAALHRAYADLPPAERARRHSARAEALAALGEPSLRLGAIPYHLEHGTDPGGAGVDAIVAAIDDCFARGCYDAVAELAVRGRQIVRHAERPKEYWSLTHKLGVCLSYLERGEEAIGYFAEIRRLSTNADFHMHNSYQMAMLYTRHLPKDAHDEDQALEWVNNAIAISDRHPDPKLSVFYGAFARNARALVELHRGDPGGALALVNEAIQMTDTDLGPDEQLLHRSVLVYNRAQILAQGGDHAAALADYDEVIHRDPEYGDYYFERAGVYRAAGRYAEALDNYAASIRLSPPCYEAHFNRADLLLELGDDQGALRDLDYALELEPGHVDSLVNRADLLLALGEAERASADIDAGLAQEPLNVNLLSARGVVLADAGDTEAACASYTAALAEDPGFVAAWANRAAASYSAGQVADAVGDLDRAIQLDADDASLRANRAIALQDLGDHRRAIDDLDVAVAVLGEMDPDLLYRRGASRYALQDVDGALADWRAHLAAYDPGETSPFLAEIRLRGGDLVTRAAVPESVA
jgi:tetratricopeptide (TPR) repeat protein